MPLSGTQNRSQLSRESPVRAAGSTYNSHCITPSEAHHYNNVIALVGSKETARNGLSSSAACISPFKWGKLLPTPKAEAMARPTSRGAAVPCPPCRVTYTLYSEGVSGWNTRPHKLCLDCYRRQRHRRCTAACSAPDARPPS